MAIEQVLVPDTGEVKTCHLRVTGCQMKARSTACNYKLLKLEYRIKNLSLNTRTTTLSHTRLRSESEFIRQH